MQEDTMQNLWQEGQKDFGTNVVSFLYCHLLVDLSGYHYFHTTQLPPTKIFRLEYTGWAKKVSVRLLWSKVPNCKLKGHHENLVVNNNVNSCTFVLLSV